MTAKTFGRDFPVVCVGGSAGGLDAYIRLLRHLPADMGVAIVIVNHLRTVDTLLHEILPRYTEMPVEPITERLLIEPNSVFIIPAQRDLLVLDGEFRLIRTSHNPPDDVARAPTRAVSRRFSTLCRAVTQRPESKRRQEWRRGTQSACATSSPKKSG